MTRIFPHGTAGGKTEKKVRGVPDVFPIKIQKSKKILKKGLILQSKAAIM